MNVINEKAEPLWLRFFLSALTSLFAKLIKLRKFLTAHTLEYEDGEERD